MGWVKFQSWSVPRMYCEFHSTAGGNYQYFYSITQASHSYKMQYDSYDAVWDCFLDGAGKMSRGNLGFTSGTYLTLQGETNATHAQIGKNAPGKLLFSDAQYWRTSDGAWPALNVTPPFGIDPPYGGDEPAAGQWRNWTNAH